MGFDYERSCLLFIFFYFEAAAAGSTFIDRHFIVRLYKARISAAALGARDRRGPLSHSVIIPRGA